MTWEEAQELRKQVEAIAAAENDQRLAAEHHVCKLWEDGEITGEKGGELLGKRTMHRLEVPVLKSQILMPEAAHGTYHSFAFLTSKRAREIRGMMLQIAFWEALHSASDVFSEMACAAAHPEYREVYDKALRIKQILEAEKSAVEALTV